MRKSHLELFKEIDFDIFEKHSIGLNISRIVTDNFGAIIDKSLLPAGMQVSYPVFLFGELDFMGGFNGGRNSCPLKGSSKYLTTFINGSGFGFWNITGFTGLNTIQNQLQPGDIVSVYTDDLQAPSVFVWIVVNYPGYSFASVCANTLSTQSDKKLGRLFVEKINFLSDNNNQYTEGWNCLRFDNIAIWDKNNISNKMFKDPYVKLDDIIELDVQFWVDQFIELTTYIQFATNVMNLTINIKKITQ